MKEITVMYNGVAKVVEVPDSVSQFVEKAYAESRVYGLGGNTTRKLKDMFATNLAEYERLVVEKAPDDFKAISFCQAFEIYSNESPLLVDALIWIEKRVKSQAKFSSRDISMENLLEKGVLGHRLNPTMDPYSQLVYDFGQWSRQMFVHANVNVGFVRFCKFFYSVIK